MEGVIILKIKSYLIGAAVGIIVAGVLFTKLSKVENVSQRANEFNAMGAETEVSSSRDIFKVISSEKKYNEQYKEDFYQVKLKNVSNAYIAIGEVSIGEGVKYIYDINPGEEYVLDTFSSEEVKDIKVKTINYELNSYLEDKLDINYELKERKNTRNNKE